MKYLGIFLLFLFLTIPVSASTYYANGTVDGKYTYYDGYWWYGNYAHSRSLYNQPGYYYGGYYYPGSSYYVYSYTHTYTPPATATLSADHTFQSNISKLLTIAGNRDKYEAKQRITAAEATYLLQAVKALGLEGNFRWEGYGTAPSYALATPYRLGLYPYGNVHLGSYGTQGSTTYAHSFNQLANLQGDIYGDKNLALLFQGAVQSERTAGDRYGQAMAGLQTLASQQGDQRTKVAEIIAKMEATKAFLKSLEGNSAQIQTQSLYFKTVPGKDGGVDVEKVDPTRMHSSNEQALAQAWRESATTHCVSCHGSKSPAAKFDVLNHYPQLDFQGRMKVLERLTTSDHSLRMPRTKEGKAGLLPSRELPYWIPQAPQAGAALP